MARVLTKLQVPKKFDLRIFLQKYHQNCLGVIVSVSTILDFIDIKSGFLKLCLKHEAFLSESIVLGRFRKMGLFVT